MGTVIGAILPLIVTLALGFFAGWHHDFKPEQASVLNRMVMLYALPLLLFAGMITTTRHQLTSNLGLAAAIVAAMLGAYLVTFVIARYALRKPPGLSALTALAVGAPAVPFAGVVVLGYLYGPALTTVPVAVGALVFNVIEVPVTLVLLSAAGTAPAPRVTTPAQTPAFRRTAALRPAFAGAGGGGVTVTAAEAQVAPTSDAAAPAAAHAAATAPAGRPGLGQHLLSTAKQPVVWAPVLALVLVLVSIGFPATLVNAMKLLGSATTGVALFASGIVLFAQRIAVSRFVIGTVAARNIIVPALLWVILAAIGLSHTDLRLAVLTNALPAPVACVIFAVQYKQGQREMASAVLFSSVLSIATLGAFIALT